MEKQQVTCHHHTIMVAQTLVPEATPNSALQGTNTSKMKVRCIKIVLYIYIYIYIQHHLAYTIFRGSQSGGSQDSDCVTEYSTTSTTAGGNYRGAQPRNVFDETFRYRNRQLRYKDKSK